MKRTLPKSTDMEPIALVGIGCRFPGGISDTKSFWELLVSKKDGIVEIPAERWNLQRFYDPEPNKPGKIYVRQGGFLQQRVDAFDALFFGIAPREAECMDPQQRLLLETSWEALEDAGIPPDSLAGSNTGVFIGAFTLDHQLTQMGSGNRDLIGAHTAIGSTMTILSNRISYVLDLRGPSMSVDTACSSSLVSAHLACQAIWNGECDLAMAGGVNIMTRPEYPVAMCKGGFLAKDGRSKSFDARADGYGRGEGSGVVVLKRLSAAIADGDNVYAVIRGTGVNQDGHTNGITVPNPESQAALIRNVCTRYNLDPKQVQYIEAHGTGTPVGDPLEAKALGSVIGLDRKPDERCLVGSIKANIGHTEAAAGVAGLIKASLCLSHRLVPPQANLETPNPDIPFESLGLRLPEKLEKLAPGVDRVLACINSFGYGGTNAHVILENAPKLTRTRKAKSAAGKQYVLPLSARSEEAIKSLARSWFNRLSENTAESLEDLCYSAACRRSHHSLRVAFTGSSKRELCEQIELFIEQGNGEWLASGQALNKEQSQPVFVFTGMGPQWWAMGRELYQQEPVFRNEVDQCDAVFKKIAGWSILDEMLADEPVSRMSDTTIAQTSNFVIQTGLVALWRSLGVEPAAIVGHSVGEVTAAYVAGVLTLEEAIKVSYHRSQIQKKASGQGKMLAVGLGAEQCADLLKLTEGKVSIAAINSPTTVTLAGDAESLEAIATYLTTIGEFNRFLQVEVPYHSHYMEDLKPEVREKLADLKPALPALTLYSTVTGDFVNEVAYDAEYWCDNIREPVYFAKALESLLRDGYRVFLEVGPHPVLSTAIKECCRTQNIAPVTFASMKRGIPEKRTVQLALAGLYTAGCAIDWPRLFAANSRYVKIPSYPWQREVYWREEENSLTDRTGLPAHPLLDHRLSDPRPTWQYQLNHQYLPYLKDHQVDGLVVMPGAAYVEAGLALYAELFGSNSCTLTNLQFHQALLLGSDQDPDPVVHVTYDPDTKEYAFFSREQKNHLDWQLHSQCQLADTPAAASPAESLALISARCNDQVNISELYVSLKQRGLDYGPCFRTITELQRKGAEVLARIALHPDLEKDFAAYRLHPTLLDGCFQSLIACMDGDDHFYMPIAIRKLTFLQPVTTQLWCHGSLSEFSAEGIEGNLSLYDDQGRLCVQLEGLQCRALASQQEKQVDQVSRLAYVWDWQQQNLNLSNTPRKGTWLVFSSDNALSEQVCMALENDNVNRVIPVDTRYVYQQQNAVIQTLDDSQLARAKAVLQIAKQHDCVGIAYLWGLQAGAEPNDPAGIGQACVAMQIMQLLNEVFQQNSPRLYFVTQGVQAIKDTDAIKYLAQSPLVGFARVALNEFPGFHCSLIDLDELNGANQADQLRLELLTNSDEDDVAFRGRERYVHRLIHRDADSSPEEMSQQAAVTASKVEAFRLAWANEPVFTEITRSVALKADEVEIELDHIDLAGLSRESVQSEKLPAYFATGIIRKVGEAVTEWREGEQVAAVCKGMPASHSLVKKDQIFSLTQLAGIAKTGIVKVMSSVIPAYYSLSHVARVKPGEIVLIDADLGDGALCFHRVALWLGANPVLYSVNDERLRALEALSEVAVFDARESGLAGILSAAFDVFAVRAWVHSHSSSHSVLKNIARQANAHEVIADQSQEVAGTAAESIQRGGNAYVGALALALSAPLLFNKLLTELGTYIRKYPMDAAEVSSVSGEAMLEALRSASQTDGLHSVVLSLENREKIPVQVTRKEPSFVDPAASYLITGGFGGFGLEVAHWLVKQGAKHLVLVGRRGAAGEAAQNTMKQLHGKGVNVMAAAADIADAQQVSRLLTQIDEAMPPLKGVFHGAAVLDDAPILDLTPQRMAAVMQAKAVSAWHLHQLTQNHSLDFFVMCSSVSALIGNGRQANYAAANTFLDALSWHRQALGLPSTTINWGAINTGMAVDSEEVKRHLALMGMNTLPAKQALECWKFLHDKKVAQYGLMDVSWPRWQEFEPTGGQSLRFRHLANVVANAAAVTSLAKEISVLSPEEQQVRLEDLLNELVAKTLRLPRNKINTQASLSQMGIDSLMAAELQAEINQALGVRISTLELMRGQNLGHLARLLADKANLSAVPATTANHGGESSELIERLSEQDVTILLNQLLAEGETVNE
ncbi:acyl transferase domain-containing protein [Nitrosomonas oligotropha]|uniref:Acyl transferase domain-containing protein n=1 Tax=Nitrosomonas oligotropha TaxID=42354 RepID=A0A2T5HWW1_9PROT|nr:type I polyketide synthase [Nitrosomonas oligotropha]PTQ76079.1 acyl transferase domain-containing protein [Nitrosomonas oligotropha]